MFWKHRKDLLDAHEREVAALNKVIAVLADQIDWLRMTSGQLNPNAKSMLPPELRLPEMPAPSEERAAEELRAYLSEEEEDLQVLVDSGRITERDMEEELARAGIRGHLSAVE